MIKVGLYLSREELKILAKLFSASPEVATKRMVLEVNSLLEYFELEIEPGTKDNGPDPFN